MIHKFPENIDLPQPESFDNPFRYTPHPLVREAAALLMKELDKTPELFAEGKMMGILVVISSERSESRDLYYLAAFSGTINGTSQISGFVPPIYDLCDSNGHFKIREAEITELNRQIAILEESDRLSSLRTMISEASRNMETEISEQKARMAMLKKIRDGIRSETETSEQNESLLRESQHEKAELRRLKKRWEERLAALKAQEQELTEEIDILKLKRASMSDDLQKWIFQQYRVHNALGHESSIAEIFAAEGLTPPGGTGECAAPKLLEYAYRNGLRPLAMGEFWYGKSPETAVRTHGHFYPSCTSKCGPLLGFMMQGLNVRKEETCLSGEPVILHEDSSVIVVSKPSGMPSVPGLDGRLSLQEWLRKAVYAVHRLDMDTSGVIIFAKTDSAAAHLRRQFEEHTVKKTYMAKVSWGQGEESTKLNGPIDLPLAADYDERPRQKVDFKQGKPAYTEYELVRINPDGTADLLLHPVTGRTHQLRVHCAHTLGLGSPILGDRLYGGSPASRLHLHALSITFRHPETDTELSFSSRQLCY